MMLIILVVHVQSVHPLASRRDNLVGVASAKLDARPVADVVFRLLEQVEEPLDRLAGDLDGLEQRPAGIRDAVDAAMSLVPTWIAQVMLHVADDGILPVEEIHGAIRADLDSVRAEIRVGGINDRLQFSAA